MLASQNRIHRSADFTEVVRRGRRARRDRLVVHLLSPSAEVDSSQERALAPVRAGFVVSKAVGGSVVRHAVTRRLRALLRGRLAALPAGSLIVVRAAPAAATASSQELAADLDACLCRLSDQAQRDLRQRPQSQPQAEAVAAP